MSAGFNGEIILERFDHMAALDHRLIITEFDTEQGNISERALDVEDFVRMAYSYPNVDGIHLWQVMRDMEGSTSPPQDRILLERFENENSTDFVHLGYPGYPNEAGIAWINLIKGEFVSNFSVEGLPGITSTYNKNMFYGEYVVKVVNPDGEIIFETIESVKYDSKCDFYKGGKNLLNGGDFDDGIIDDIWKITNGKSLIHWDGYIKDGLKVKERSGDDTRAVIIDISKSILESGKYVIQEWNEFEVRHSYTNLGKLQILQ